MSIRWLILVLDSLCLSFEILFFLFSKFFFRIAEENDAWFESNHPLHSPGASRALKLRSNLQKQANSNKGVKLRYTPKRALLNTAPISFAAPVSPAAGGGTEASPGRRPPIPKKLTFPSPAREPDSAVRNENRKRERRASSGSIRIVGSGPFSEARQRKVVKTLVLDETESNTQPDLVQAATTATGPQPFEAASRRLLFQLSPNGPTLVTAAPSGSSLKKTSPTQEIFAELEKLSISSGGKENASRKRVLTATPPRTTRIGGKAVRVAPSEPFSGPRNAGPTINLVIPPNPLVVDANSSGMGSDIVQPASKRGRSTTTNITSSTTGGGSNLSAGANVLSRMQPKAAGSGSAQLRFGAASRPQVPAPSIAPSSNRSGGQIRLGVEHIVAWEKRTGRSWYKLTKQEKQVEIELLKENLRN